MVHIPVHLEKVEDSPISIISDNTQQSLWTAVIKARAIPLEKGNLSAVCTVKTFTSTSVVREEGAGCDVKLSRSFHKLVFEGSASSSSQVPASSIFAF